MKLLALRVGSSTHRNCPPWGSVNCQSGSAQQSGEQVARRGHGGAALGPQPGQVAQQVQREVLRGQPAAKVGQCLGLHDHAAQAPRVLAARQPQPAHP